MNKKKVLYIILGCMFLGCDEEYIKNNYVKNSTSVSNTVFERRLFEGYLSEHGDNVAFFSAPSVGWFPKNCKKLKIAGFTQTNSYYPIQYNASYFFSSFSKTRGFKKSINKYLKSHLIDKSYDIRIIACEMHLPYLNVVKYLKKRFSNVTSILFVPDLPEYNNRSNNLLYKILKRINSNLIYKKHSRYVDVDVFFSKEMQKLGVFKDKDFIINEGLTPDIKIDNKVTSNRKKRVVYIGKLDKRNGIELISAAADLMPNYSFEVYGLPASDGLPKEFVFSKNIVVHGYVSPSIIPSVLSNADILLSPRFPEDDFTAYSFPSKLFDYLSSGKPIVTFKLRCYPDELGDILIYPKNESLDSFIEAIEFAASEYKSNSSATDIFLENRKAENVIKTIDKKINKKREVNA